MDKHMKRQQMQKKHDSKFLTLILRHKAKDFNLNIDSKGFVKVNDIINLPQSKKNHLTIEKIKEIVKEDKKGRFELTNNEPYLIRCVQGHSIREVSNESALNKLNKISIFNYPTVVHGTYKDAYQLIEKTGLNRMNRNAIHFSIGFNWENQVKSGMRLSCEIFIEINMVYSFFNGIEFFLSENNVVLSSGINGIIPTKFFKRVLDKNQNVIFACQYDCIICFEKDKILLKKTNENLIEVNGNLNDFGKLNEFVNLCIDKEYFKEKIITVVEKDFESSYLKIIKENVENSKILFPQIFVDYVLKKDDGIYKGDDLKKVDINWIKVYSNNKNIQNGEKEEDKKEEKKEENKEENKEEKKIITEEKLTKEIIADDSKIKYYILIFINYDEDGFIDSIDILIINSNKMETIINQTNFRFTTDKSLKKNYENFINKLRNILQSLNILNKRLVVCITAADRNIIIQDLYKYSIIPPKLFLRNIILLNSKDFSEVGDEEGDFYKTTVKIFISNYLSSKRKIDDLSII